MANPQLAPDEANLSPDQVSAVDYRRQMGLVFQVISGQLAIMSTLMTWWIGQDIVYARPWGHLIVYYFIVAATLSLFFGIKGTAMRRGVPRLD
jgi:hypothetical protein